MKLALVGLYDRGSLDKERIHVRAEVDLDLTYFIIVDSHYLSPTAVEAGNRMGYWFVPRLLKKGEHAVVYTRAGSPSTETRPDGSTYHFVFRGHANTLYASPNSCAVLMEVQTWVTTSQALPTYPPPPPVPPAPVNYLNTVLKR